MFISLMCIKQQSTWIQLNNNTSNTPKITFLVPCKFRDHNFGSSILSSINYARMMFIVPSCLYNLIYSAKINNFYLAASWNVVFSKMDLWIIKKIRIIFWFGSFNFIFINFFVRNLTFRLQKYIFGLLFVKLLLNQYELN